MPNRTPETAAQPEEVAIGFRSHPKTSRKILSLLGDDFTGKKILDLGAGPGAFTQALFERIQSTGPDPQEIVTACDLFPDDFRFAGTECRQMNFNKRFPLDDASFDVVVSIEVIEHLSDQFHFIREVARITRPGGRAFITTPNILNANGRFRFFFTGTWPLFDALPVAAHDVTGVPGHIGAISLYYIYYFAMRAGFHTCRFHIDRVKRSAALLAPFIWAGSRLVTPKMNRKRAREGTLDDNRAALEALNSFPTLVGRTVIVEAIK